MLCTVDRLDAVWQSVKEGIDPRAVSLLGPGYAEIRATFNPAAVDYCMSRYIDSELDTTTPGNRGIGRVTEAVPRLGAYFRKQMEGLSPDGRGQLSGLIQDVVLAGYLSWALTYDDAPTARRHDGKQIFQIWVPEIYTCASQLGAASTQVLESFMASSSERLLDFYSSHQMKRGLFSKDRIPEITAYYGVAGLALRIIEMGPKK